MARYRTYKNGITGHRYKGYYIIKGTDKGMFSILNEDKTVFKDKIYDFDESEWIIDKETANPEEYEKEIYQLSSLFIELMQKKEKDGLDEKEEILYRWIEKVRRRKAEDRVF